MIYLRELFRCLFITFVFVSIVNDFYKFPRALRTVENKNLNRDGETVLYANKTTPKFMVRIFYNFPRANDETDSHTTKTSNLRTQKPTSSTQRAINDTMIDPIVLWNTETIQKFKENNTTNVTISNVKVGNLFGTINNGQLIVQVNETYAFWNSGATKLCQLLRDMTLKSPLNAATNASSPISSFPRPLLNLTIDCEDLSKREDFGQGNWVTALYVVRMTTALAKVEYQFQCSTGRDSQLDLLLPWFDGYHASPSDDDPWPYDGDVPMEQETCNDRYRAIRIDKMSHEIQKDIRRMATTLLGRHTWNDQPRHVESDFTPLMPGITIDEVAIHFRCGDIMGGVSRGDFGMIKFTEYPKWINNDTRSIGILTQPFEKALGRRRDAGRSDDCRAAVHLLIEYLKTFYPDASIQVRNDANETLPLVYARLAMAKQSFTSLTSFGIFPVVGTFGEGYFQKGNAGVNPFASYFPQYLSNLHEMTAPVRSSSQIKRMGLNSTLDWFVTAGDD